jgi:tetratricopeptide (TPR) repeat protein
MEAVALIFVFVLYIMARLLFSGKTALEKDAQRFETGLSHIVGRRYPEALDYFGTAVNQQPRSALAWTMLGISQYHCGDLDTAGACLYKACQIDNLSLAFLYKGKIAYDLGIYDQALIEFNKAIWFDRKLAEAHRLKANCLDKMGQYDLAITSYRDAVVLGDEISNGYLMQSGSNSSIKKGKNIE